MADKVIDNLSQEQFVLCLRLMNVDLNPNKEFINLHVMTKICADTLVECIQDVFIRMNLIFQSY